MAIQATPIQLLDQFGNPITSISGGMLVDNAGFVVDSSPALVMIDKTNARLAELQFLMQMYAMIENALNSDPRSYYTTMEVR